MSRSLLTISSMILLSMLMASPAHSVIYSWRDASGVVNFSNDPGLAPRDAEIVVGSMPLKRQTTSPPPGTKSAQELTVKQSPSIATQGDFVAQLVAELGLGGSLAPNQAAGLLAELRIAPPLGDWQLDMAMTPELIIRLRVLTVAAAEMEWITITPEQALLAFDTTAALLGVPIPIAPSEEVAEPSYPIVEVPPLVYVYPPPPAVTTYYTWVPVPGGFWWHEIRFQGFFVLDHNLHLVNGHHFAFEPHVIRRHFVNHHVNNHHVVNTHAPSHRRVAATHPPAPPVGLHRQVKPQVNPHMLPSNQSGVHDRQQIVSRRVPMKRTAIRPRSLASPPIRKRLAAVTPPRSHWAWSANRHDLTGAPNRFSSGTLSTPSTSRRSGMGGHGSSVGHGGGIGH